MIILFPYMARWNSANRSRYYHLFNKIADLGHTVVVVQPPPRDSDETNYIDLPVEHHPNIRLVTVRMPTWLWKHSLPVDKLLKKALYSFGSYVTIRRLVRELRPNFLVLYNLPQYIYTFKNETPVVFDFADDYLAMLQHELNLSEKSAVYRLSSHILEKLVRRSKLVTIVSQRLRDRVRHTNILQLSNGADECLDNHPPTVLHIDRARPVVGYVGAFEYFIDLELMLEAAERLPRFTFILVGAGREFLRIKDSVAHRRLENVILTGAVHHRQAMQFISEMDICLCLFKKGPVADAASPIKLFEYIASGKPVIATRLTETLRIDQELQSLVYADTLEELLNAITWIEEHPEETKQKVARSMEIVRARYSWSTLARQLISRLEEIQ